MKHIFTIFAVFLAALCSAQSSKVTATQIRAEESLRVGTTSSQKVTGFDLVMPGTPTHTKLPTSKCIYDWVTGSTVLIGGTAGGDLNGAWPNPTVDGLQGFPISSTTPIMGQVLKWTGSQWVPGTDDAGPTYGAGAGIAISVVNQISNTGDLSNTNELQNISLAGQALGISSGTGVTLPVVGGAAADFDIASGVLSLDYTNAQKATAVVPGFLTAADWTVFNAKDPSATNEIQALSIAGQNLTLSLGGGTVVLPPSSSIYNSSGNAVNGGSARMRNFRFKTDTTPSYNADAFNAELRFGGTYLANGTFAPYPGYAAFVAGDPAAPFGFSQFSFDGEQKILQLQGYDETGGAGESNYISVLGGPGGRVKMGGSVLGVLKTSLTLTPNTVVFEDDRTEKKGIEYADYYPDIESNSTSLPSVANVRKMFGYSSATTATTSVGGEITVTHGVGATPIVVTATYVGNNPYIITVTAKDAATFTVKVWDSAGDAVGSTPVTIDWFAR